MDGMNRIQDAINQLATRIDSMDGVGLTGRPLSEMNTDLAFDEFVAFQDIKSTAQASGLLTVDEALTIYAALGGEAYSGGDGWPDGTGIATKVIVNQVCAEMMGITV